MTTKLVSIDELEQKLLTKRTSIQSTKGFPSPIKRDENGVKQYKKKEVEYFLKTELTDFIDAKRVTELLNTNLGNLMFWINTKSIPFYRLKRNKGSKLLFKESEILEFKEKFTTPERNDRYSNLVLFTHTAKNALRYMFGSNKSRSAYIFLSVICDNKKLSDISKEFNLSKERISQIFTREIDNFRKRMIDFDQNYYNEVSENRKLKKENLELKNKIKLLEIKNDLQVKSHDTDELAMLINKLSKRIEDYLTDTSEELSVRTVNSLKGGSVDYLYELISIPKKNVLYFRNFGRKSYDEILSFLNNLQIKFISEINNPYELSLYKSAIKHLENESNR